MDEEVVFKVLICDMLEYDIEIKKVVDLIVDFVK